MDLRALASKMEYNALQPFLRAGELRSICDKAASLGLRGVCVLPSYVQLAHDTLRLQQCRVICAVAYPYGSNITKVKLDEAINAAKDGADELEMVINHGAILEDDEYFAGNEIYAAGKQGKLPLRVMLESSVLTPRQLDKCAKIAWDNGADMLVLNTGLFAPVSVETVAALRSGCKKSMHIKACGGIATLEQCESLLEAGADIVAPDDPEAVLRELYRRNKQFGDQG